MLFRENKTTR